MDVKLPPLSLSTDNDKDKNDSTGTGKKKTRGHFTEFTMRIYDNIDHISFMSLTSQGPIQSLNGRPYQPASMLIHWSNEISFDEKIKEEQESKLIAKSARYSRDRDSPVNAKFNIIPPAIEFEEIQLNMSAANLLKAMIIPGLGNYADLPLKEQLFTLDCQVKHDVQLIPKLQVICQRNRNLGVTFDPDNFFHWFKGIMIYGEPNAYQDNSMKVAWVMLLRYCELHKSGKLKGHPMTDRAVQLNVLFALIQQSHFKSFRREKDCYTFDSNGGAFDVMKIILQDHTSIGICLSPLDIGLVKWHYHHTQKD